MSTRILRLAVVALLVALVQHVTPAQQLPAAPPLGLDDLLPLDPAVRTSTLPNGLRVFVRRNDRPAKRVSLRLAVKTGSINEADDQQGLAHLIEHMAFNGSAHFKPGEVFAFFESVGARLGPHVNAYTTFDETVYMLDLPSDRPDVLANGLTALADFAGGLKLDAAEIDKERGVVIEEWRLGLGASSRIRDRQFPVIFYRSRYAERLPIGKPEVIRNAPAARLRDFYDAWYRPERMAVVAVGDIDAAQIERDVRAIFSPLAARAPAQPDPDRTVPLHQELLVNVATDSELTQSSVSMMRKRPREGNRRVGDYRRDLVQRLVDQMIGERFTELARAPEAPFLSAGAGGGAMSSSIDTFSFRASVQNGKLQEGLSALAVEASRIRAFGFGSAELERAKRDIMAAYDRSYAERDKTETSAFAREYVDLFLEGEPAPGIDYEYRLARQLVPGITLADVAARARVVIGADSRVVLATSPQRADVRVPSDRELEVAIAAAEQTPVTAWRDSETTRELIEKLPPPGNVVSRRELPALGVTIVRFSNGVEAWLKPTDFKNDQVIFTLEAPGGASLASPAEFSEATLATSYVGLAGVGGIKALDLQRLLSGSLASASPFISLSSHGISGGAAPVSLETALKLLYLHFTAPNDDRDAFALLKRQLSARLANREESPQQVFGDRVALVNTSSHFVAQPLTVDRVATLDAAKMMAFYRQRFSNAADFTMFMVGTFNVDEAVPLLARYVGALPSTGRATANFADMGMRFPSAIQREGVEKGREPRSQAVISFFAEPGASPVEQEQIGAAISVVEMALRDVLREELGQTYSVGVGLSQPLPQRGSGHVEIRFGSAPENLAPMVARVLEEVARLQREEPSADRMNRTKQAALRTYETSLRENGYWLRRLSTIHAFGGDPNDILTRGSRIDALTPQVVQDALKRYFPLDRYTVVTLAPAR